VQHVLVVDENIVRAVEESPFAHVFAVRLENLHPRVLAIGDVYEPAAVDCNAVRKHELAGPAAGLAPGEQKLSVRGEFVNPCIAVPVGDVHVAIGQHRDVGDAVKRAGGAQHRAFTDLVAGIGAYA
jgi:hypothetical protein